VCLGVFSGGRGSCLNLHFISSRPKVGVYIPVKLKFWPLGASPPPPRAHVWLERSEVFHNIHIVTDSRLHKTKSTSVKRLNIKNGYCNVSLLTFQYSYARLGPLQSSKTVFTVRSIVSDIIINWNCVSSIKHWTHTTLRYVCAFCTFYRFSIQFCERQAFEN